MVSLGKLGSAPTTPTSHDDTKHSDSGEHILRDGTVPFTGNQAMGAYKLTGLAAGAASGEAVEYDQLHSAITLGGGSAAELTLAGQALTLAAVLTPTEHTAIGNGAPHHAAESGESATHNHGNLYYTEVEHGDVSPQGHHDESHNVASHSDTTGTGTELNTLTDGSDSDALHTHTYANLTDAKTIGIGDDNLVEIDDADAADDDYAKFTANGLEGRSYTEVRSDINVANGADVTGDNAPQAHAAAEHSAANIIPDANQAYTGDMAITGALTATSYGGITEANLVDKAASEAITGSWDFGGAAQFEIPNDAAPTAPNADGEIVVDLTVADWSHGIFEYYGGELMGVVAMPIAQFTSPTDNHVVTYNATTDEFELQAGGGGGGQDLATDTLWAAAGDLVKGTGDDAADILSIGAANSVLVSNGTVPSWDNTPTVETLTVAKNDGGTEVLLDASPTTTGVTGWTGLQISPDLTILTGFPRMVYGIAAAPIMRGVAGMDFMGTNMGWLYGLYFQGTYWATEDAANMATVIAVAAGLLFKSDNAGWGITVDKVSFLETTNPGGAFPTNPGAITITVMHGLNILGGALAAGPTITTMYGAKIEDFTGTAYGTVRLLEVGPSTPYLRVVGKADPAAGDTNLYLKVGGSLLQVWSDGGTLKVK